MADSITRLKKIFSEKLLVEVATPDTDLFNAGILDSMAFVELLLNVETEFGFQVAIADLDIEDFRSISRIAEWLEGAKINAQLASL